MHALVVYESLFGNTGEIAEAVATGVRAACPEAVVDCARVDTAPTDDALPRADLVVVGAPTHFWGMTSRLSRALEHEYELRMVSHPSSRRQAVGTSGMRAWLAAIPPGRGTAVAAFDTRMDRAVSGGAAPAIARHLDRRGYRLVAEPRAFIVQGIAGPLQADQAEQARRWARQLVMSVRPG